MAMKIQNNVSVQQLSQPADTAATQGTQKVENVPVGAKSAEAQQNEKVAMLVTEFKQLSIGVDGKELKNMRKAFLSTINDKNLRKAVKKELKASEDVVDKRIELLIDTNDKGNAIATPPIPSPFLAGVAAFILKK
jgi:hypothetical protein